jgi:hypothetical protein
MKFKITILLCCAFFTQIIFAPKERVSIQKNSTPTWQNLADQSFKNLPEQHTNSKKVIDLLQKCPLLQSAPTGTRVTINSQEYFKYQNRLTSKTQWDAIVTYKTACKK